MTLEKVCSATENVKLILLLLMMWFYVCGQLTHYVILQVFHVHVIGETGASSASGHVWHMTTFSMELRSIFGNYL